MARQQDRLNSLCRRIFAHRGFYTGVMGLRQYSEEPRVLGKPLWGGGGRCWSVEHVFYLGRHVGILDAM